MAIEPKTTREHIVSLYGHIKGVKKDELHSYSLNDLEKHLPQFDLLINATSVGHKENPYNTPVSRNILTRAKQTLLVYDIIYDPLKTKLLKISEEIGLRTINGLRMNLIQAVLAYSYTNPTSLSNAEIFEIMN